MTPVTFDFHVKGAAFAGFRVAGFSGTERLTRPYRFDVDVISGHTHIDLPDLVGQAAQLTLHREQHKRMVHGRVTEVTEGGRASGDTYAYRVTLEPRIALLSLSRHNRTFGTKTPMSVIDVITAVLTNSEGIGLAKDDYEFRLLKPELYPVRDFWAQYEETDLDFVHRLMEHWGLFYYFEQEAGHERIVIIDSTVLSPIQDQDGMLPFDDRGQTLHQADGAILSLHRCVKAIPRSVHLRDYNDQTPHVLPEVSTLIPDGTLGVYHEYATHFANNEEGKLFSQARADEISSARDVFDMVSTSPFLSIGTVFQMKQHFRQALNQRYLPTTITHSGWQSIAGAFAKDRPQDTPGYQATIVAIPGDTPYRSPRVTKRPNMAGIMPAFVEATEEFGTRAAIDEQGRYKVAINFDTAENEAYSHSTFVRMVQPYGGTNAGMHFPLLKGAEVMVGWVDGDPDRPLIIGAVPNPATESPVTEINRTENRIQTASGISFVMDDGPGEQVTDDATQTASRQGDGLATSGGSGSGGTGGAAGNTAPQPMQYGGLSGVYSAFAVPTADGGLPHYLRIGDISANAGYESRIVNDESFQAGIVSHRPTTLNSDHYSGVFTYTPDHYTTTIGGNETKVVGGDHYVKVGGKSNITVTGGSHTVAYGSKSNSSVGADSAFTWNKVDSDSPYYSASSYYTPKISYYDSQYMSVYNGITLRYAFGIDLRALWNFAGTFQHRVGASLSLSGTPLMFAGAPLVGSTGWLLNSAGAKPWGSSYSLSTSGYTYKQIAGIDKSHAIFATDAKGIVLGFRGPNGKATMTALTAEANKASYLSLAALAVAEGAQTLIVKKIDEVTTAGIIEYSALELAAVAPLVWAYVSATKTVISYFNDPSTNIPVIPNQADLIADKALVTGAPSKQPTVTINDKTITLLNGTSSIVLKSDGIEIIADKITLSSSNTTDETSSIIMTPSEMTVGSDKITVDTRIYKLNSSRSFEVDCDDMKLNGDVAVTSTLEVQSSISSKTSVSAPNGKFG